MKSFVALLVLGGTVAFAAVSPQHHVAITGYETGEFAAKGTIEQSLDREVVKPITEELVGKKAMVNIFVVGSADLTGKSPENDGLGLKRANDAAAHLERRFAAANIDAHIVPSSKGQQPNEKKITVEWYFKYPAIVPPIVASQKESSSREKLAAIFGFGALVMFATGFAFKRIYKRKQAQKPRVDWLMVRTRDDITYGVKVEITHDDRYILPFCLENNPEKRQVRKGKGEAEKTAKWCIKKADEMGINISSLLAQGLMSEIPQVQRRDLS